MVARRARRWRCARATGSSSTSRNRLAERSTIHWHGLHIPFAADGSPYHPVEPGETFDYVFTVPIGSAGTYWYHPHPDHRTGPQVAQGLYGALVVRAADDPLPASLREQLLVLPDNRFRDDGSIDLPAGHSPRAGSTRRTVARANVLFVNGKVMPTLTIRSGEVQRWRVINASAARVYRLAIAGHTLLHVGTDGGLFERPVEAKELVLGPAERVEVLVRGTGAPGSSRRAPDAPLRSLRPADAPRRLERGARPLTLSYCTAAR